MLAVDPKAVRYFGLVDSQFLGILGQEVFSGRVLRLRSGSIHESLLYREESLLWS